MREKTISRSVENDEVNPLRVEKESKLIVDFAVPCIISMLVTSLYNIVDQIFIGQGVGMLGNAATNIAFPLSIACTAISLLLGIGAASNFSLHLGAGEEKKAVEYARHRFMPDGNLRHRAVSGHDPVFNADAQILRRNPGCAALC